MQREILKKAETVVFVERANINATSKKAEYINENPGLKTVSLIVNGDFNYIGKKADSGIFVKEEVVGNSEVKGKRSFLLD